MAPSGPLITGGPRTRDPISLAEEAVADIDQRRAGVAVSLTL